jgi:hypothetical protein
MSLIKLLKEKYSLLERRTNLSRNVMFHGTTDKFLKSILSQGLQVKAKSATWEDDKESSFDNSSRKTYGGIYLSNNLLTALSSARNAVSKLGGKNRIVISALIQSRSSLPDEDSIKFSISRIIASTLTKILNMTSDHPSTILNAYSDVITGNEKEYIDIMLEKLKEYYKGIWPDKHENLNMIRIFIKELLIADFERKISYIYDFENEWKYDFKNIEQKDKKETEHNYMVQMNKMTKLLKNYSVKPIDDFNNNVRILQDIGFSGRNKILSIAEIDLENKNIIVHYGELPKEFMDEFNERWSRDYQIIKKDFK